MTTAYVCHLFLMCLYITVTHTLPAPANLTLVSHNFRHVLQWNPGRASPPRTVFNLQKRCREENATVRLNITDTTVDVSDIQNIYNPCTFTVWASLDNTTSARVRKRITPYEDTIIGPPIISLSGCGNCLNISISLPAETSITDLMERFYKSATFNISWRKAGQSEVELISTSKNLQSVVLENLRPGEQYCVSVIPQITSNLNTRASAWQCEYTSKEEPRGGLYLMSWSLGSSVLGVAVLLLALGLLYTGSLCKIRSTPPTSLNKIVHQDHFLVPEETFCERVCSTEARVNTASKPYPSNTPSVEDPGSKQHEENYANKADTEDEEDDEEEEKGKYIGCVIDDSGSETNKSKEKAGRSPHVSGEPAIEEIHRDKLISEVLEDGSRRTDTGSQGDEEASGDISLFSVTLRTLGPQDSEVCEPLLLDSVLGLSPSDDSVLEEHTEDEEEEEEELVPAGLRSGYMVTHTGDMSEHERSSSEEADCDTDYITR